MTDRHSLSALLDGARAFRTTEYRGADSLMARLSMGQEPDVLVIACSDSRVDPALVLGARPGDLFVVRVVANLVPARRADDTMAHGVMAAVEYGSKRSGSRIWWCAAIPTAAESRPRRTRRGEGNCRRSSAWGRGRRVVPGGAGGEPGAGRPDEEVAAAAEQRSVLKSLANLRSYGWIQDRVEGSRLALHGWWFDIDTGHLWIADTAMGLFRPLD